MNFTPILKSFSSFFRPSPLIQKKPLPITVMILSPHPDDESIIGSLPLRLMRENGARVVNVAVTLGSNKARIPERLEELKAACGLLEMELIELDENWKKKEKELRLLIQKYSPALILAPHLKDHHPTHIKTGELLLNALSGMKNCTILVAWTEFWGQMKNPNLLIEVPEEIVELQMRALEKHQGEIARNPYHLRLPAWMMDNVRRGSELIDGKGARSAQFAFGVLYRLQLWKQGKFTTTKIDRFLSADSDIGQIFKLTLDAASGSRIKVK